MNSSFVKSVVQREVVVCGLLVVAAAFWLASANAQTSGDRPKVGLPRGSFVAAGGGAPADVLARFIALAGGPDAPIVAIPASPAGAPSALSPAQQTEALFRSAGARNVTVIETYNRNVADSESFVAPMRRAFGFWVAGGTPEKLIEVFAGTKTEQELRNLLARGGVVGGTSAGAMILGSYFGSPLSPALGFLRNVIFVPHATTQAGFREGGSPAVVFQATKHAERIVLAMDERTAWEIHGDTAQVIGTGSAFVLGDDPAAPGKHYYTLRSGDQYNMAIRTVTRAPR